MIDGDKERGGGNRIEINFGEGVEVEVEDFLDGRREGN